MCIRRAGDQRDLHAQCQGPRAGGSWPAMGIHGMELFAIAVVIVLFIAVLKQFGILEPMSMEGNKLHHLHYPCKYTIACICLFP